MQAGAITQWGLPNPMDASRSARGDTHWEQVAAGYLHTVAIKTDGTLWAWGDNGAGQLGDGTAVTEVHSPEQIGTDTHWEQVGTTFGYSSIALKQ